MSEITNLTAKLGETATDTAALMAAGAALGEAKTHNTPDARPYAVVPDGYAIQTLPTARTPERPRALVRLRDAASFIKYWADHHERNSRIFATLDPARFLAVFDEFLTNDPAETEDIDDQANWREFRAIFEPPASREWKLWTGADRKAMGQLAFAEFLQDNLPDVTEPDGAALLEMALNFEAAQSGTFVATQRLQNGSHNLQWRSDNNASGTVQLPEHITLSIPVFENEQPSQLTARLRYRVKEGALSLWYELVRPHKVLESAFRATWDRIAQETGAVLLLGMPE